jgi:hypothetical protein
LSFACGGWLERVQKLLNKDDCFSSAKVFKQSKSNEFLVHVDYMLKLSKDNLLEFGMGVFKQITGRKLKGYEKGNACARRHGFRGKRQSGLGVHF